MRRHWTALVAAGIGALSAIGVAVWAEDEAKEEKVSIDRVPAAVKEAILKEDGQIEDIAKQTADGKVIYETDLIKDGKEIELRMTPDGALVSRKIEGDAQQQETGKQAQSRPAGEESEAQAEARACVRGASALADTKVTLAEAVEIAQKEAHGKAYAAVLKPEGGKPRYEVQVAGADTCLEVVVDGVTGKVLETEVKGNPKAKIPASGDGFCRSFKVDKANLVSKGRSAYFVLEPGHRTYHQTGNEKLTITILNGTKVVDGVECGILEEKEEKNGQLAEISRNFLAIDKTNGNVYYFGEEVDNYKDGKIVNHESAWLAGENGARFGLMIPGKPKAGDKYYQEIAPKVAMDRVEIVSVDETLKTPAGTFEHCVHLRETTPLESDVSHKWYAPGIGLVKDDEFTLVKIEKPEK